MNDDLSRACEALHAIPPGISRPEWIEVMLGAVAAGVPEDEIVKWSSSGENFTSERDVKAALRTMKRNGKTTAGTLFHHAKRHGWRNGATKLSGSRRNVVTVTPKPKSARDPDALWKTCEPAAHAHPYIKEKLGLPEGLRTYRRELRISGQQCDGALVIPLRDLNNEIHSLQFVPIKGKKVFLPGAKLPPEAMFVVGGNVSTAKRIYLGEGIGQAWSAHMASGAPAVCCFGISRMAGVAKAIHAAYPQTDLVVVADRGKETEAAEIARTVSGGYVEMPADKPKNFDFNDLHCETRDLRVLAELLGKPIRPAVEMPRFPRVWLHDVAIDLTNDDLVKGLIGRRSLVLIYGPSGDGKTFFSIDLFAHVAIGIDWRGRRVRECLVVYVAAEAGVSIVRRFFAWRNEKATEIRKQRIPLAIITRGANMLNDLDIEALIAELKQTAVEAGTSVGAVVIDTLSRSLGGGNENAPEDMTKAIEAADRLRDELGATVAIVHHSGKDPSKGSRGHSSLYAAADTVIKVVERVAEVEKSRDSVAGDQFAFELQVVKLGEDQDGDPITTCLAKPSEMPPAKSRQSKLSGVANVAMTALREAISEHGRDMPGSSTIPPNVKAVTIDQWRTWFVLRYGTCDNGEKRKGDAVSRAFLRARESLTDHVAISDPYVWAKRKGKSIELME